MPLSSPKSILVLLLIAALTANAAAYIDAGTGSVITQVLIAGSLGALLTIKGLWQNVKKLFSKVHH